MCVCISIFKRYAIRATRLIHVFYSCSHDPHLDSHLNQQTLIATGSKPKTTWTYLHEPHGKAIFFDFPLSVSITFFEFLDFGFSFLSPVCPLMKPPRNRTTISPTDSDSKQPHSFLRINKVQASLPKAQLVSFKLALKTGYARLRCVFSVFSVCVCVCVCVCLCV